MKFFGLKDGTAFVKPEGETPEEILKELSKTMVVNGLTFCKDEEEARRLYEEEGLIRSEKK